MAKKKPKRVWQEPNHTGIRSLSQLMTKFMGSSEAVYKQKYAPLRQLRNNTERDALFGRDHVAEDKVSAGGPFDINRGVSVKVWTADYHPKKHEWSNFREGSKTIRVHRKAEPHFRNAFRAVHRENMKLDKDDRYAIVSINSQYGRYINESAGILALVLENRDFRRGGKVYYHGDHRYNEMWAAVNERNAKHNARVKKRKRGNTKPIYSYLDLGNGRRAWGYINHKGRYARPKEWGYEALKWDRKQRNPDLPWISNHAYGTAIDVNASWNGYDKKWSGKYRFDMPKWVVEEFLKEGFHWGGFYGDYMHFEWEKEQRPKKELYRPARPKGAKLWTFPVASPKTKAELCAQNAEQWSGFFPVGLHNTWHGGVHLSGDTEVRCVADGRIVAARLVQPHKGPGVNIIDTHRCFVLVRHDLEIRKDDKLEGVTPVYSLYMHLDSLDLVQAVDAQLQQKDTPNVPWLARLMHGYHPELNLGKSYWVVSHAVDPEGHKRGTKRNPAKRVGVWLRNSTRSRPRAADLIRTLPVGTVVEHEDWHYTTRKGKQRRTKFAKVRVVGSYELIKNHLVARDSASDDENATPETGLVFSKNLSYLDKKALDPLVRLSNGEVVPLNVPVHAGDKLGDAGVVGFQPAWHFEIFSGEALHEKLPELKDTFPNRWEDPDDDPLVDLPQLGDLVDKIEKLSKEREAQTGKRYREKTSLDRVVHPDEASRAATVFTDVAAKFTSEWALDPRASAAWAGVKDVFDKAMQGKSQPAKRWAKFQEGVQKQLWWKEAAQKKAQLPKSPKVWHYHPITFVDRMREAVGKLPEPEPAKTEDVAPADEASEDS